MVIGNADNTDGDVDGKYPFARRCSTNEDDADDGELVSFFASGSGTVLEGAGSCWNRVVSDAEPVAEGVIGVMLFVVGFDGILKAMGPVSCSMRGD